MEGLALSIDNDAYHVRGADLSPEPVLTNAVSGSKGDDPCATPLPSGYCTSFSELCEMFLCQQVGPAFAGTEQGLLSTPGRDLRVVT